MSEQKIIHGDCLEVLKTLEADSVDLIATDPPYGYSFMGKDWDKAVPSVEVWKECLRVLKPGAFAFVMSAPRSDVQWAMIDRLQQAGFRLDFTPIYWTYASGFPKAMNIGKMVDKRNGVMPDVAKKVAQYVGEQCQKKFSNPELARLLGRKEKSIFIHHWANGNYTPRFDELKILAYLVGIPNELEKDWKLLEEEAEREVVGHRKAFEAGKGGTSYAKDGGWSSTMIDETLAKTEAAKALDGSYGGFQPKPAIEVIIVAMKPLSEKTFVDQALKNGKGITWLDDVRIPFEQGGGYKMTSKPGFKPSEGWNDHNMGYQDFENTTGRFPANAIVSDDVLNDGRDRKTGAVKPYKENHQNASSFHFEREKTFTKESDSGSYSRYFSLDAWSSKLPDHVKKVFPFLIVPKASKGEKGKNCTHPTVKPLTLMQYLITLGSREGDLVLDPFVGSGTTALAAKTLNRKCIGIERESEYVEIAEARLKAQPMSLFAIPEPTPI